MKSRQKALQASFALLILSGCATSVALPQTQSDSRISASRGASSRDLRAGFGRPETISGTISSVDERGVLILKREGPSEPATTQLTVSGPPNPDSAAPARSDEVQTSPGPGQTDYTFRITSSTQIQINGQNKPVADLAGLGNRRATVRFIPRRSGNFASSIDVRQ